MAPPQQGAEPSGPMTSLSAPDTPLALETTRIDVAIGTPLYRAPEQLEGKGTGAAAGQFV